MAPCPTCPHHACHLCGAPVVRSGPVHKRRIFDAHGPLVHHCALPPQPLLNEDYPFYGGPAPREFTVR